MTEETLEKLELRSKYQKLAEQARGRRERLLKQRDALSADVPLRFWNQQAHFTTPASGTPEKAIRGLAPVKKILNRFGIDPEEIAKASGAPLDTLNAVLESENTHSPFVMVDVEDAVALTEESLAKARLGAVRCFTQEDWGPTLPFFRPSGLRLESCVDDLLIVLPEVARDREAK